MAVHDRSGGMNSTQSVLTCIMRQVTSRVGRPSSQLFEMPKEHSLIGKFKRACHPIKGHETL